MKIKLFIFDLDRTIVVLPINWIKVKKEINKKLEIKEKLTPLFPKIEKLTYNNLTLRKKIFEIIEKEEIKIVKKISYNPEIYRIFRELKNRKYKIALITFQSKKAALKILKKLKILNFFNNILTREDSINREEQIRITLNKFGFEPSKVIVIADKDEDILAAKKIGCKTIAVRNKKINSNYKIRKITELLNILNEINKKF
ncbi:MAG: HAD hydrolase-like protein [Nitrososphaerota archaeon]